MTPVNNNQNVLVDFKCLFDTDLGSAMYLRCCSSRFDYFHDFITKSDLLYFRYMALSRKEENPIEYLFKPEYAGHADTLYGEMKSKKWSKVLSYSPVTEISRVLFLGIKDGGYKVTVNCSCQEEVDKIKELTNMWSTVIDEVDISKYQVLYVYYIQDIVRRKWNIDKKVVYLYDWSKNHINDDINQREAINPLAIRWADKAIFNFIKPYSDFELPVG